MIEQSEEFKKRMAVHHKRSKHGFPLAVVIRELRTGEADPILLPLLFQFALALVLVAAVFFFLGYQAGR